MKRKLLNKKNLQILLFLLFSLLFSQDVKAITLQGSTNAEKVFRYFSQNGYSDQASAAIVGNIMNEGGKRRLDFPIHTTEETNATTTAKIIINNPPPNNKNSICKPPCKLLPIVYTIPEVFSRRYYIVF